MRTAHREIFGDGPPRCDSCGVFMKAGDVKFQHIVPISKGGTDERSNILALCTRCHFLKTAEALTSFSNIGGLAGKAWADAFSATPKITAILTVFVASLMGALPAFVGQKEDKRPVPSGFVEQMETLEQTQKSLDRLSKFISTQREEMKADQQALASLQEQRRTLAPLLKADREMVTALLRVQEEHARENARRERWIGFGLGVIGSLLASAILAAAGILIRKRLTKVKS